MGFEAFRFTESFKGGKAAGKCREAAGIVAIATRIVPPRAAKRAHEVCCPDRDTAVRRKKDLSLFVRICCFGTLIRGLQNLGAPCEGERVVTFCVVQKVTKKHAGLRPATSIQISGRYMILFEETSHHQVTGYAGNCHFAGYRRLI